MSDKLSGAVEELEVQLQEQLQEAVTTKKLINSLLKRMGQPERYTDTGEVSGGPVRGDMYYGKAFATAVQMVLDRIGHASTPADILKSLEEGGFDFRPLNWGDAIRMRNVAISMAKNKVFHKLPNGTFGLAAWYDAATINASKREKAEKAANAADTEDEIAGEELPAVKTSA
jgi:hypothetical protein